MSLHTACGDFRMWSARRRGLSADKRHARGSCAEFRVSPLRTLAKITIPLIAANLVAGALLAFSFAMLEVSDSLYSWRKGSKTIQSLKRSTQLYQLLGEGRFIASALGVWAMCFLGTILLSEYPAGQKAWGSLSRVAKLSRGRSRFENTQSFEPIFAGSASPSHPTPYRAMERRPEAIFAANLAIE